MVHERKYLCIVSQTADASGRKVAAVFIGGKND
jgi:hypothetical protein